MMNNYVQKVSSVYLIFVIVFLFLTPSFPLPGLPAIRLEEISCVIYLLHIALLSKTKGFEFIFPKKMIIFYMILLLLTVSIINSYINGYSTSLSEIIEFIMWTKFVVIYFIAINAKMYRKKIIKTLKISSILLFFLVVSQYFNFFGMNEYYIDFVAPTQSETLLNNYANPRAVGMVGNPNALAYIFLLTGCLSFYLTLNEKMTLINVTWFIISTVSIILTQSRTAFLCYVVGNILIILLSIFSKKQTFSKITKKTFLITIVPIISYTFFQNDYIQSNYLWRFGTITNYEDSAGWQQRLVNWSENIELIKEHYILGLGPLRGADIDFPADNEWLLLLRVHGIIGTCMILLLIFSFLNKRNKNNQIIFIIIIVTFIYMLTSAVINSLILMPILIIILTLFSDYTRRINDENLSSN